jgi:hypothetical protein
MNKFFRRIVFLLVILSSVNFSAFSSETYSLQLSDTLEIPFFDDFSYCTDFPDENLWVNKGTNISTNLPKNPPSIGALVFDALDTDKKFYKSASYGSVCAGDTVETKPINLYYPNEKSVYLSFYYQGGGYGDRPESTDSLCLDFYSPLDDKWTTVKRYEGAQYNFFKQEIINISERKFLQKGFRFRFRNYFSLGSSLQPDLVSNCDFWMVDYVKLDKNRNEADSVYNDVSLTALPVLKVGDYQSVPWQHYKFNPEPVTPQYTINYRNNDDKARLLDSINLTLTHDGVDDKFALGTFNMPGYMDFVNTNLEFLYNFDSKLDSSANYEVTVKLVSDVTSMDFAGNNQITVGKEFYNYYAYDDGTAEAAYGLHGEGSTGGFCAVRFVTLKPDKLNGVNMYFCPVFNDAQAGFFNLKVWNCVNGLPSTEIYSKDNVAVPKDKTNQFVFVPFDELIQVTDTFFIGWEKLYPQILALGFDKNTAVPNNKFYNLGGTWKKSSESGQIMIRPTFGYLKTPVNEVVDNNKTVKKTVKIFPNPASDYITLQLSCADCVKIPIDIYSIDGRKVKSLIINSQTTEIDVSDLPAGMYLVVSGKIYCREKLLIVR